jgi:hypothetical protein
LLCKERSPTEGSPTEFDDNGHSAVHSSTTIWTLVRLLEILHWSTIFLSAGSTNSLTNHNKYGSGIQVLQAALIELELLIVTASVLKDRKCPGCTYCVYNKTAPSSLSTLHVLVGGNAITTHDKYNQLI